jgi:hypothetical protein
MPKHNLSRKNKGLAKPKITKFPNFGHLLRDESGISSEKSQVLAACKYQELFSH